MGQRQKYSILILVRELLYRFYNNVCVLGKYILVFYIIYRHWTYYMDNILHGLQSQTTCILLFWYILICLGCFYRMFESCPEFIHIFLYCSEFCYRYTLYRYILIYKYVPIKAFIREQIINPSYENLILNIIHRLTDWI